VGTFDDAFISRIHVIIAYDKLNEAERKRVWKQFFDKLCKDRKDITVTGRAKRYVLEDSRIFKVEWNGREIRNGKFSYLHICTYVL
jgi:ATP-dependent Clp protease ATP-binding subunit ClpA